MVKKKELTYEVAMEQLKAIIENLENNSLGIDSLSKELEKAQALLAFCKERLGQVEQEVKTVLEDGQR